MSILTNVVNFLKGNSNKINTEPKLPLDFYSQKCEPTLTEEQKKKITEAYLKKTGHIR